MAVRQILIAEDNKSDIFLIRESLALWNIRAEIHVCEDGERAIRFIERVDADAAAPCPDLVLLDINLPRFRGNDILRRLRTSPRCSNVPVIVVSSADSREDRDEMARLGANGYFRKPSALSEFMQLGGLVQRMLEQADEASAEPN